MGIDDSHPRERAILAAFLRALAFLDTIIGKTCPPRSIETDYLRGSSPEYVLLAVLLLASDPI